MPTTDPPATDHADRVRPEPGGDTAARHIATLERLLALDQGFTLNHYDACRHGLARVLDSAA